MFCIHMNFRPRLLLHIKYRSPIVRLQVYLLETGTILTVFAMNYLNYLSTITEVPIPPPIHRVARP